MGAVFWAYDQKLNQDVAVKLLTGDSGDEQMTARFRQEAKELSSFTHPNIVTLLDFGQFEGEDYIVLEFLRGGNLLDWIAKKPSVAEVVDRFASIAQGLDYIHNRGIVHRDLKPENILLTEDAQPRITDFGVARRMEKSTRFTAAGTILGTSTYMAPEQIMSSEVGPPADIYSLGVCLFEALTGQPPFVANQHFALLQAHLTETAPSARSKRPDIPEELDRLVARMLKKKPEERPGSAQEVLAALKDLNITIQPEPETASLVDRPKAWGELMQQLDMLKAGEGVGCHLVGPSGSGRSRLLKQFCQEAKIRGIRTLVLSPHHEPTESLKRIWHLLGPTCPLQEILAFEGATGCATWLRKRLETGPPTILVADDSERHYPTALSVLRALSLLTPPPGSGWLISSTPAQKIADSASPVIELSAMERRHLDRLFEGVRGTLPGPLVSSWLESRSAGWPRQAKLLAHAVPDPTSEPPSDLAGLARRNLERLSENARLTLEVICLAHSPAPYDLLLAGTGLAHRSLDKALGELVEGGYAEEEWTLTDCFRVGHDLYKELINQQLPERTARRLNAAMAHYYEKREDTTLRGRHLLAAGDVERAYPVLLEEADRAKELGFLPLAHQLLKSALTCSDPPSADLAESQCRLAEVALESGAIEESKKILSETAPKSLGCKLQTDVVRTTMANMESEPVDESKLVTPRNANPTTIREMHLSITLHRQLAKAASRQEDFDRAHEHLRQAFKLANHLNEPETWGQVLVASGYLKLSQGDAAEAEVEARQAIEKTRHSENPRWRAKSFELLGEVQMALGAPSRAALSFQQALEISRDALLDKRCLKLERKFHKAQKGEPLTPPPAAGSEQKQPAAARTAPPEMATPSLPAAPEAEIDAVAAPVEAPPPAVPVAVAEVVVAPAAPLPDPVSPSMPAKVVLPASPEPAKPVGPPPGTVSEQPPAKSMLPRLMFAAVAFMLLTAAAGYGYQVWSTTPGRLIVTIEPSTVTMAYSDQSVQLTSGQPLTLPPGNYDLTFSADGFQSAQRKAVIPRGGEFPLELKLEATHGSIKLVEMPPGATVYLNGQEKKDLKAGQELKLKAAKYTLKFTKRLYATKEVPVDLQPGEVEEIKVALTPIKSELKVTSDQPKALILLNGKKTNWKEPLVLNPGLHRLKASLDGYITQDKEIELKPGDSKTVSFAKFEKEPPPPPEPAPYVPEYVPEYVPPYVPPSNGSGGSGGSGGGSGIDWQGL
jgi:serine/threonine protein kinase/tetratricopeptide (TPR) repeat protein